MFRFDDSEFSSSSAKTSKGSSSVSEDTVTSFVDFPSSEDSYVAFDCRFKDEVVAVELCRVLLDTLSDDGLFASVGFGRPSLGDTA
jgi:hypothetical protein